MSVEVMKQIGDNVDFHSAYRHELVTGACAINLGTMLVQKMVGAEISLPEQDIRDILAVAICNKVKLNNGVK